MNDVKHHLSRVIMPGIPLLLTYPYLSRSLNAHVALLMKEVIDTPRLREADEGNGDANETSVVMLHESGELMLHRKVLLPIL